MYYRIAVRMDTSSTWKWKSTILASLGAVFGFLRLYRTVPRDYLRVFSSCTREAMGEQLAQENSGQESNSVMVEQFLRDRKISSREIVGETAAHTMAGSQRRTTTAVLLRLPYDDIYGANKTTRPLYEEGLSALDRKRLEMERGAGGDHDTPYTFALPHSTPQTLAWVRIFVRVQNGELQP